MNVSRRPDVLTEATAADVLTGADPKDRSGNIARLVDAGWSRMDAQRDAVAYASERAQAATRFAPQPLAFDFDAVPDPPDWIVHGVIERGTVALLSGDTGAAKSIVSQWLTVSALTCREWLGRTTNVQRVLYVDEENPDGLATARLRAMGLDNAAREQLRYFSREGFTIGREEHDKALTAQLEEFRPDLVVVDTLMSATAVDVNDNVAAVKTMKHLRALAREHSCAVLLLHHERKQQKDGPAAGSSQQTLGARQWAGQADALMTIATETDMQRDDLDGGHFKLRRTFKLRLAEKDRDGRVNGHRRIAVQSEKDERERLLWMTVTDEGPLSKATAKDDDALAILGSLAAAEGEGWMGRKDIAAATGEKNPSSPSGTWKSALKDAVDAGHAEHGGQRYRITADGRGHLAALRATAVVGAV